MITCCTPCPGQTSRGVIHDGLRVSHAASRPSLPRCGSTAFATSSPIDPAASGSSRLASSANHGTVFTSLSLPWVNAETFQLHGQPLLRRCGSPFCYGLSGSVRCSSVALFFSCAATAGATALLRLMNSAHHMSSGSFRLLSQFLRHIVTNFTSSLMRRVSCTGFMREKKSSQYGPSLVASFQAPAAALRSR